MKLLQRCGNIVKLCVLKENPDDAESASRQQNSIDYSVEINRKGQPLGITISTTNEATNSVLISQLNPGGLAERFSPLLPLFYTAFLFCRTGALHVGDRIVAINGESLEGKRIAQVTQLLQNSKEPVSIRICRQTPPTFIECNGGFESSHFGGGGEGRLNRSSTILSHQIFKSMQLTGDSASETSSSDKQQQ